MDNKLTALEKKWILYDVGNSAFILLATTIIPILFNNLAKNHLTPTQYVAYWGYAVTASTLIVALLGPILGAISDQKDKKKSIFNVFMLIGVIGCAAMPFFKGWFLFLVIYVITKVGFNGSLIFYDSMLSDITTTDRMDRVSSHGFVWGYIGSCIPFIISIGIIFSTDITGISTGTAMILVFAITALWWLIFTIPLLKSYQQSNYSDHVLEDLRNLVGQLKSTFYEIRQQKKIYLYLIAFFFYIDGVFTIINMATAYGTSLGLSSEGLILALLVTQIVAFPCALFFSRISKIYPSTLLIKICIIAYTLISLFAIQLDKLSEFWILAIGVGMFQGAIQALSRSYYAKIIPPNKSGEYFGIYDIFGKSASFFGTLMVSLLTQLLGNQNQAIISLSVMFVLGYIFFNKSAKIEM